MQYGIFQEIWDWREGEARRKRITRVKCVKCRRKNAIVQKMSE